MFGLTDDSVRLWVDCNELPSAAGMGRVHLNERGSINSNGYFSIAKDVRTGQTVVVEVHGMSMSCDIDKPIRTKCEELKYGVLPMEEKKEKGRLPDVINTPIVTPSQPGQCSIQCPQGPPGFNGTDVSKSNHLI